MRLMATDSDEGTVLPPIPMNVTDIAIAAINRKMGASSPQQLPPSMRNSAPNAAMPTVAAARAETTARPCVQSVCEKPMFFKDANGNEYRMKGGRLYIKGWSDTKLKFRLLNATTGKELSLDNKKIQIYGWHVVETVAEEKDSETVCSDSVNDNAEEVVETSDVEESAAEAK